MGEFEYAAEDMLTMDIELRYDYAHYTSLTVGGAQLPKGKTSTVNGDTITDGYNKLKGKSS